MSKRLLLLAFSSSLKNVCFVGLCLLNRGEGAAGGVVFSADDRGRGVVGVEKSCSVPKNKKEKKKSSKLPLKDGSNASDADGMVKKMVMKGVSISVVSPEGEEGLVAGSFPVYPDEGYFWKDKAYCDFCRGGNVTVPSMVLNLLYLGPGSCSSYYKWGVNGLLPRHMCDPLTSFAYVPCGCVVGSEKI